MRRSMTAWTCASRRIRLGENPALAGIKHLNRLENVLAAAEAARHDVFESLLLDASGNLVSRRDEQCVHRARGPSWSRRASTDAASPA